VSNPTASTPDVTVRVCMDDAEARARLLEDARRGLAAAPKDLPPKWFYDEEGSRLFEEITQLPEYYPTRAEREILVDRAEEVAEVARAEVLVELGSGAAVKTRILLDALHPSGTTSYLPFDVCEEVVRQSGADLAGTYESLSVQGVVGDFEQHLHLVPRWGRQLVAFLGGTIGNLLPHQRHRFLRQVRSLMESGDHLLLGADLVKDPDRLVAAYDDPAGVTARFNRNVLSVLNRELAADFDPDAFDHVAVWDDDHEWIEMRLRARADQTVTAAGLDTRISFGQGEEMRTEVSAKFRPDGIVDELGDAGLDVVRFWTDRAGDFSLVLAAA
jgi:L-histidine Nalpha-methyltransferase